MNCSPPSSLCPWDIPGKITGVGCHFLFQRTFLTQRLNPCLLHCKWILYHWATCVCMHAKSIQAPLPMEFSRWEYWNGLPFPAPEDLPNLGMETTSLVSPALAGGFIRWRNQRTLQERSKTKQRCLCPCHGQTSQDGQTSWEITLSDKENCFYEQPPRMDTGQSGICHRACTSRRTASGQ